MRPPDSIAARRHREEDKGAGSPTELACGARHLGKLGKRVEWTRPGLIPVEDSLARR